jgi:hypothetical protein
VPFCGLAIGEDTRMENAPLAGSGASASFLLGRKLDSIPFSIYHIRIFYRELDAILAGKRSPRLYYPPSGTWDGQGNLLTNVKVTAQIEKLDAWRDCLMNPAR